MKYGLKEKKNGILRRESGIDKETNLNNLPGSLLVDGNQNMYISVRLIIIYKHFIQEINLFTEPPELKEKMC